ncbi:primosomal protein N' [Caenibacillus caldisaponilyticus]|uniref:primosomal protein N' n=1 Tax=Caenibacillus caldisaponilyticus TaxID=1674942 RepID=UPI0009887F8F|nr:primosomal protein N' [Caenibacillus caldisaponilyticus]
MIARVIVDLATRQTDRPFDYLVPSGMEDVIERGARVIVPFGARKRLGFVVDLTDTSAFDHDRLRPIETLVDQQPVLTPELLALGDWLAEETLCFKISAYQAMLPAALKADYHKQIAVADGGRLKSEHPRLLPLFENGRVWDWDVLQKQNRQYLKEIKRALSSGALRAIEKVEQKGGIMTEKVVRAAVSKERLTAYLEEIGKRAPKQRRVIEYFLKSPAGHEVATAHLADALQVTRTTIKALIEKGLLVETEREVYRDPYRKQAAGRDKPALTAEQRRAMEPILRDIAAKNHRIHLCHGVTGSGKTEIYLQAIEKVIEAGREAIVLVPEISLTPQMVERFKSRFGSEVAVLHSGLSRGEKYDEWRKIHRGEVSVAVGARSAVFAPFTNLGLIVIDEEHETSYKQEETPRYHAREVAAFRGRYHSCPVILGSATPSMESYARGKKGVYELSVLSKRINGKPLPPVEVVDMRDELRAGNHSMFSRTLFEKLKDRLEKGEQSVLFLNRRGYSTFVLCRDCGHVLSCPHCDISLTYHRSAGGQMKCHYCGYIEPVPRTCPRCGGAHIRFFGSGTQKVEEELAKLLPEARVIRMDVDTTQRKGAHERLLKAFGAGEADILLGTQMIAKGLDFPNVTLVGVLAADAMLRLPDFRAAERTFQLLTQVAGRAGRRDLDGEVVVQTYAPDHYAIELSARHDYTAFYEREMTMRKRRAYPPYYFLTLITVTHETPIKAADTAQDIARYLKKRLSQDAVVLGPVFPAVARIKDRYRCQCMVKYKNESRLLETLKKIVEHYQDAPVKEGMSVSIDINPYSMM